MEISDIFAQLASGQLPVRYQTVVTIRIDSHNFGRFQFSEPVMAFSTQKANQEMGTVVITLAPYREWLDMINANDLINLYVNINSTDPNESIYNRGNVREFFGYVSEVRREEIVNSEGELTVRYVLVCADFQKPINMTEIYNNQYIDSRELFGRSIAGDYALLQGIAEMGPPRFLIMNHLAGFLGFGKQWVLPVHYQDFLPEEISHNFNYNGRDLSSDIFAGNVKQHFADRRRGNDVLRDVQNLRVETMKYTYFYSDPEQLAEWYRTEDQDRGAEDAVENPSFYDEDVLTRVRRVRSLDLPHADPIQHTIDVNAPKVPPLTIFDILCFDYMEYVDGFTSSQMIWQYQGSLYGLLQADSHDVLNELIIDLRPTIDFYRGSQDGIGTPLDGALAMVPCVVLREYPFTYYPEVNNNSIEGRLVDVTTIRKLLSGGEELNKNLENLEFTDEEIRQHAESGGAPSIIDFGGAVWRQNRRVTDYGDVIGMNSEQMLGIGDGGSSLNRNMRFNRGPRTLEHISITSNDIYTSSLGRGDQDAVTGFEFIPIDSLMDDLRYYNSDLSPIFRLALIRRHGLRMMQRSSEFTRPLFPDASGDQPESLEIAPGKTLSARQFSASFEIYMTLRCILLMDHWYQHNTEYITGTLVLRPMPGLRVGYRLDWLDRNMSFYVEAVNHEWRFPNLMITTAKVTRGQPIQNPLQYFIPDDRVRQEESESFKLAASFPVADDRYEDSSTRRRVLVSPGEPGRFSPISIFQNLRVALQVQVPSGVNSRNTDDPERFRPFD